MNKKRTISSLLFILCSFAMLCAHSADSLKNVQLQEVTVTGFSRQRNEVATIPAVHVSPEEIRRHMGHSLMDALSHTEGVHAMDIGIGFSKPMIRGLGFQRIAVTENGVKQEGQQWGADHGLEIDAFNVSEVRVVKGPASVLYGSDALGGAVEILPVPIPLKDSIRGEVLLQHQSVSSGLSGSAMLAMKRKRFFTQLRYTERHWADYRVPANSFTYLSTNLPIHGNRMKNTAGLERGLNWLMAYRYKRYEGRINVSDSYQKAGFFSGAHGVPNSSNLLPDGNSRNIELPYNKVNHFKVTNQNKWTGDELQATLTLGYQLNHREEWSKFHTHNYGQQPPAIDPDKELMLHLHTGSSKLQIRYTPESNWEHYFGISAVMQKNTIGGYGFLIPEYDRSEYGAYYLSNYRMSAALVFNGSVRYDIGRINTKAHGNDVGALNRHFNDYSFAFGATYTPNRNHELRGSIGRAFRLPSANELTSNGVHHGAFRHERGDATLVSEQGWQADLSYNMHADRMELRVSPFFSYYSHFIALHPTGLWSPLPDAGQVYKYVDTPAVFAGSELRMKFHLLHHMYYELSGEYVHTYDTKSHTATPFSPPASMRNTISWECKRWELFAECHSVARQNRVTHNEDATPGYNLINMGGKADFQLHKSKLTLLLNIRNMLNTRYLNHLSFYRKIELPEAGFDFQTTVLFTF